jgi:hypothetical protein
MKQNRTLLIVVLVSILAMYGVKLYLQSRHELPPRTNTTHTSPQSPNTFTTKVAGLSFTYFGGSEGYILTEREKGKDDVASFMYTVTLMTTKDAADLNDRINTEGPPTLQLAIYSNDTHETLDNWITNHPMLSNSNQKISDITQQLVGGERALNYTIDGLYLNQVTVITHDNYILVASGAYFDTTSKTYLDYQPWLETFTFKK